MTNETLPTSSGCAPCKSIFKNSLLLAAITFIIPALFFPFLKHSIQFSEYTTPLKWLFVPAPILLLVFGIQGAKSDSDAKKYIYPLVICFALFIACLAPTGPATFMSGKVFVSLVFSYTVALFYFGKELIKHKFFRNLPHAEKIAAGVALVAALGIDYFTSNISLVTTISDGPRGSLYLLITIVGLVMIANYDIVSLLVLIGAYFYDSDLVSSSRFFSHWFAYVGFAVAMVLATAVASHSADVLTTDSGVKPEKTLFEITNAVLWVFFATLFVLS